MRLAAHQSQYLPWPPYFKKIAQADVFVWMDNVQFQKNGLQNRNKIWTTQGELWLTIPVSKGKLADTIAQKTFPQANWQTKHLKTISASYSKAPFWKTYADEITTIYSEKYDNLDAINRRLLAFFLQKFDIQVKIHNLSELDIHSHKSDLVLDMCRTLAATEYLSGQGGKNYLCEADFQQHNIKVIYSDFAPPTYAQYKPPAIVNLSMLDMLMNVELTEIKAYLNS